MSAAALVMTGCVSMSTVQVTPGAASGLKGQSVVTTIRKPLPDFAAVTPGKAMFGVVGAMAMISEGNSIIANNSIADPAEQVAKGLNLAMASRYASTPADNTVSVSSDDVTSISQAAGTSARFAIDVQTVNWSISYFPTDWTHYRVIYTAKARLIDTMQKSVIAEGFCKHIPESNANAPSYDELMANHAALLKSQLSAAANNCISSLQSEMLAL